MKLVLIGVGSFVLALVAGAGIRVVTAPAPKPPADSATTAPARPGEELQPVAATSPIEPVPAPVESSATAKPSPTAVTTAASSTPPTMAPAGGATAAHAGAVPTAAIRPVAGAPNAKTDSSASPESGSSSPVGAPPGESYKSLARILASMKPAEAGKIIAYFSDPQVEGILRASGVRQAAVFLSQLPTERAAALARRLMIEPPKESP